MTETVGHRTYEWEALAVDYDASEWELRLFLRRKDQTHSACRTHDE